MKTLSITISDEAAARLAEQAADNLKTSEELASSTLEGIYAEDWFEALDPEVQAGIREGVAEADRGEFATDEEVEEVFNRFKR